MEIKLFVTVGDKAGASLGVRFLSDFFENRDRLRLTLCHMVREEPRTIGEISCDEPMCMLLKSGFSEQQIETHCLECGGSLAGKILESAEKGGYSAIVLGKRGLSWLESMVESSTSLELLHMRSCQPYWICRPPREGQRNVLLCVDGTEQCRRMVEHVGDMLVDQPRHRLILLHVAHPVTSDLPRQDEMFDRAWTILEQRGFPGSRIRARVVEDADIVRAIVRHAEAGNYAAVAVGSTAAETAGHGLKRYFMGSVSMGLFRQLRDRTLWVCQ